jgi:hypothetical protein
VSVSTRDQRVTVRPFASTNDSGYATVSYGAARGTFWCRVSPIAGAEATTAGQADHVERCVFEFADSVTVGRNDLLIDRNGVQWKVESVTARRVLRQKLVRAYRSDDQPNATLG